MNASLITAETPVETALRLRPRLADNLAAFGADLWDRPRASLGELFRNRDTLEKFLETAAGVPVPGPGSAWVELPPAHLADHLTQNHRDFFWVTLPDVNGFFGEWGSPDPEVAAVRGDFEAFMGGLRQETEGEERDFFPRVLRYDACLRDPSVNPEFNGGSLRVAVAYRNSHKPALHPDHLRNLVDRLGDTRAARDGNHWAHLVLSRLEDFHAQFEEHERLESEVLYPMALEMEKTLYNLSIAGVGRRSTVVA